jgi:hypothetical protein
MANPMYILIAMLFMWPIHHSMNFLKKLLDFAYGVLVEFTNSKVK